MLKKLLKYDFIAVLKYWWIAALTSFLLSIVGGGCIKLWSFEKELPTIVYVVTGIILFLVIISYIVFVILSKVFIFTRFYRNFFTDEGYLTFTLPVKRAQLLNSKLIVSTITTLATNSICILNIFIMLFIGLGESLFTSDFSKHFFELISVRCQACGWYLPIYILILLGILILSIVFSSLLLFFCITFASIIMKKAKVITAIGIYYGINSVISFITQIFNIFGTGIFTELCTTNPITITFMLIILLFMAIACTLLYTLEYWLLDRKLNLN